MKLRKLKKGETLEVGKWLAAKNNKGLRNIEKLGYDFKFQKDFSDEYFEVLDFDPEDIEVLPDPQPGELWKWRRDSQITVAHIAGDKLATANGLEFAANDGKWKPIRLLWVRPEGWQE